MKFKGRILSRNLLDDLRLAVELFLKELLQNNRPLEKQPAEVGQYLKAKGTTAEFRNMFITLLDYFSKYQNIYVKHDDAVVEEEIEFVFELTSSFLKHLLRLKRR